jgi:hypothetical protein
VLWLITFATSIAAFFIFYAPALDDVDYIVGAGEDARVATGAFLEMLLILANVGTALVCLPILRRQNYALAHGYLAAGIMECVFIAVGTVSMLAILTLRSDGAENSRGLAVLALVGGSLITISGILVMYDVIDAGSPVQGLMSAPEALRCPDYVRLPAAIGVAKDRYGSIARSSLP